MRIESQDLHYLYLKEGQGIFSNYLFRGTETLLMLFQVVNGSRDLSGEEKS